MATIVTRAGKGSPLTNNEVDANFVDLNTELVSKVATIASADGSVTITGTTAIDLSVAVAGSTSNVLLPVRNTTGATLTKGTAVYISGATGQISTVSKAIATSDATSAQTLGLVTANISNNSNGNVTLIGTITNMDTSAYSDGQQLYLSPATAGTLTATKPYAPNHLVYMAVVEHAHPTQGKLFVKVQNGYEMDELHDVSAQSPTNGQTLVYNSTNDLWEKNTVSLTAGVNGTLPVANGGTGATSLTSGYLLKGNGTSAVSASVVYDDGTNVGIGTTAPASLLHVDAGVATVGRYGSSGAVVLRTASGTQASPTAISSSTAVSNLVSRGYDGSAYRDVATISVASDGAISASSSPGYIQFNTTPSGSTTATERMRIDSSGNVGIGTASPTSILDVFSATAANLNVRGNSTTNITAYRSSTDTTGPNLVLRKSRGTSASPTAVATGDTMGTLVFSAFGGTNNRNIATIASNVEYYVSDSILSSNLTFSTTSTSTTPTEVMRIDGSGNVGIATASPGAKLDIVAQNAIRGTGFQPFLTLRDSSDSNKGSRIQTASAITIFYNDTTGGGTYTERMRIDASGNVGIGTTGPGALLQLNKASGAADLRFSVAGTLYGNMYASSSDMDIFAVTAIPLILGTNNTERMRITSAGDVGIGTSSPGFKLEALGGIAATTGSNQVVLTTDGSIEITRSTGDAYIDLKNTTGEDWDCRIQSAGTTTPALTFSVNGSERMRITDAGNVGIGTSSPGFKLDVSGDAHTSGSVFMGSNADGWGRFVNSGGALYIQAGSLNSGSATAQPIIFTNMYGGSERMRITAAGNVGIGTSNPVNKFEVVGPSGGDCIMINRASNAAYFQLLGASFPTYNAIQSLDGSGNEYWGIGGYGNANTIVFRTNSGAERMRITSAGNVAIGNSNAAPKFSVTLGTGFAWGGGWNTAAAVFGGNGAGSGSGSGGLAITYDDTDGGTIGPVIPGVAWKPLRLFSDTLKFYTNGATERMRIGSNGGVAMGGTGTDATLHIQTSYGGYDRLLQISPSVSNKNAFNLMAAKNSGGTDLWWSWGVRNDNVWCIEQGVNYSMNSSIGIFFDSGGQAYKSGGGSWASTSDARVKTNIAPISDAASRIMALKPSAFDYRIPEAHQDRVSDRGFIAQEFEEVYPHSVSESAMVADAEKAFVTGGDKIKAISLNNDFFADLVALVQEQQTTINDLRARVAQLEGK